MNRPFRRSSSPPRRTKSSDESRVLSSEEKRELILAHAAAREQQAQSWGAGYYIGIAASCLVVVTGWWLTVGSTLRTSIKAQPDPNFKSLQDGVGAIHDELDDMTNKLIRQSATSATPAVSPPMQELRQAALIDQAMKDAAERVKTMTSSTQKTLK